MHLVLTTIGLKINTADQFRLNMLIIVDYKCRLRIYDAFNKAFKSCHTD
ncbi:MAG: hypothetical protein JWR61_759 [Ferruginibacter sp.]|nr:hypothetical protein [Ferruginibacter sp.]